MVNIMFSGLFILLVLGLALEWLFLTHLKQQHTQTWIDLGSRSLLSNNSINNALKILRFKWGQTYKKLNDPWLDKFILTEKWLLGIYWGLFIILILSAYWLSIK